MQLRLLSEVDKAVIDARPYYDRHQNYKLEEFDFAIDCKKRTSALNIQGEQDLMERFKKWAHRNGLGAIITRQEGAVVKETIKV